jgi:hypothetical protein
MECQGALVRDQTCDCKKPTDLRDKYKVTPQTVAHKNPWLVQECPCEKTYCRSKHYTPEEKERVKRALWRYRPNHQGKAHRPKEEEACLSMALECKCKFGEGCRFSHNPLVFPEDLSPKERQPGKIQQKAPQREDPRVLGKRSGNDRDQDTAGSKFSKTGKSTTSAKSEKHGKGAYFTNRFDERPRNAKGQRIGERERNRKWTKEEEAAFEAQGWANRSHVAGDSDLTGSEKD